MLKLISRPSFLFVSLDKLTVVSVDRVEHFHRLDLYDEEILDYQVCAETYLELKPFKLLGLDVDVKPRNPVSLARRRG